MAKKSEVKIVHKDGGYEFPDFGIHVAADSEDEARARVRQQFGINVEKDAPPAILPDHLVPDRPLVDPDEEESKETAKKSTKKEKAESPAE